MYSRREGILNHGLKRASLVCASYHADYVVLLVRTVEVWLLLFVSHVVQVQWKELLGRFPLAYGGCHNREKKIVVGARIHRTENLRSAITAKMHM